MGRACTLDQVSLDSRRCARLIFIATVTSKSPTAIAYAFFLITYCYSEYLTAKSWTRSSLSSRAIRFGGGPGCEARRRVRCLTQRRAVVAGVVDDSKGIGRFIGCLVAQCPKFGICPVSVFRAALELRRFAQRWGSQALAMGGVFCDVR